MSDVIHLLPDSIANQIAAGEVIQRPASVVKELVENALDAGATHISVNIKDAGRTLIQVVDDGKGMSETDARMAFERHATSKITSADDLFSLHTMGFRGEALASIAAVAQVELRTRLRGSELGTRLVISGADFVGIEPDACAEGSIFSVKNLFFNVPARRKFLKSNETEFRNIIIEFERIALVNPRVAFVLSQNDVEVFNLPASGVRQRIVNVYGKSMNQKLLPINVQSSLVSISGFMGRPDSAKKRGAQQYLFVNGRFMKHFYFHKAVMQAYEGLVPPGEQPDYFIYFTLDPSTIDVNIHPTKTEIKFENEQSVWQILLSAAREALAKSSAIPTLDFGTDNTIDIPVYNPTAGAGRGRVEAPSVEVDTNYNPFASFSPRHSRSLAGRTDFDWSQLYKGFEKDRDAVRRELEMMGETVCTKGEGAQESAEPAAGEEMPALEAATPCYQYKCRYIVTSLKSGMALVDQHRAHVRVLFDRYLECMTQQGGVSQQMLFPEVVELTAAEAEVLTAIMDDLRSVGFDLSDLGNNTYAINGLPADLENVDSLALIRNIVSHTMETGCEVHEEICEAIALSLAEASAVRAGQTLSSEEMDHLIASLFSCRNSNLTPDGKTILSIFTDDELLKRFG